MKPAGRELVSHHRAQNGSGSHTAQRPRSPFDRRNFACHPSFMTALVRIAEALSKHGTTCERLYRVELQRWSDTPLAYAPQRGIFRDANGHIIGSPLPSRLTPGMYSEHWKTEALFHDLHTSSIDNLLEEISLFLEGQTGRWRARIFVHTGEMVTPKPGFSPKNMFLYDYNPRGTGEIVQLEPVFFDLGEG